MDDFRENVIEFVQNGDTATVTFCQGRYITRIKELAEKKPDKCQIMDENEDRTIVAHIPVAWIKINPERELTEEQLEKLRASAAENFSTDSARTGAKAPKTGSKH